MYSPLALLPGSTIRIISPSDEMSCISPERQKIIELFFNTLHIRLSFGLNTIHGADRMLTIQEKVDDIHNAFLDPEIKAIFSVIGGLNANSLLPYIDWNIIRTHPKIWCGYSDIDVLSMAIYAKTGMITYTGPHYSTLSQLHGAEYTIDYFKKALMSLDAYDVVPSIRWSNDAWYRDQENREFFPNSGFLPLHEGAAEGVFIGSNLSSLLLLKGTPYMPSIAGAIIGVEMDERYGADTFREFCRKMDSLIQLPEFSSVKALMIGRFPRAVSIRDADLALYFVSRKIFRDMPIVANMDFGHTDPRCTLPIGGRIAVDLNQHRSRCTVLTR